MSTKLRTHQTLGVGSWVLPDSAVYALLSMKENCADSCQIEILFHATVSLWNSDRSKVGAVLGELKDKVISSTEEHASELQVDFWILYVEMKGRSAVKELIQFYSNLPRLSQYGGTYINLFRLASLVYTNGMSPGRKRMEVVSRIPLELKEFMDLELADYSRLPSIRN